MSQRASKFSQRWNKAHLTDHKQQHSIAEILVFVFYELRSLQRQMNKNTHLRREKKAITNF